MSQLQQLKQTINGIAESAKKTGTGLAQYDRTLTQQISSVQQAIGGSSNGADRKVLASLQNAQRRAKEATAALQEAARTAADYGRSL